jgi:hypothetical protein
MPPFFPTYLGLATDLTPVLLALPSPKTVVCSELKARFRTLSMQIKVLLSDANSEIAA